LHNDANGWASAKGPRIPTAGELFPDGHAIELVADPEHRGKLKLLEWDGKKATAASLVAHGGLVYEPLGLENSIFRAMRLPTRCAEYASTKDLFADVAGLFKKYLDLPEHDADQLAGWSFSTWFSDCLPSAPGLSVYSPDLNRESNLQRLLACTCRRPLALAEVTSSSFRLLPMQLRPTLLLNRAGLTPRVCTLLHTSTHRGFYLPGSKGGMLDPYGAKALFAGMNADSVLNGEAIQFSLAPAQHHSLVSDACLDRIARQFQPRLLMYRLLNSRKVRECRFDVPTFTFPTRELARNLGACLPDDPGLAQCLVDLLEAQDRDARAQRCTDVDSAIVEVILVFFHKQEVREVGVQKVTELTNTLLRARGEILEYSPEEIGRKMARLGLRRHRNAAGQNLLLCREVSRRVHRLGRFYGVLSPQKNGAPTCAECAQAQIVELA
jgi:hypothetical protein